MMLDLTKNYVTRSGKAVTALRQEYRRVSGCVEGCECNPRIWKETGEHVSDSSLDLVEEPEAALEVELLSGLPDGNPKTAQGVKKPGISAVPPSAILHLGQAMRNGKERYGAFNWRSDAVTASTYYDAAFRHLAAWHDGEEVDGLSGVTHLGHAMACCAILLDAQACGKLLDDRVPGPFCGVADGMTKS